MTNNALPLLRFGATTGSTFGWVSAGGGAAGLCGCVARGSFTGNGPGTVGGSKAGVVLRVGAGVGIGVGAGAGAGVAVKPSIGLGVGVGTGGVAGTGGV